VLLELAPFFFGGLAVFFGWPGGSAFVEERPVRADQIVLKHRGVGFRGGQVLMAE
jgi:hypothetical protein